MQQVRASEVPDSMCLLLVDRRIEALDGTQACERPHRIKKACTYCLQTADMGP